MIKVSQKLICLLLAICLLAGCGSGQTPQETEDEQGDASEVYLGEEVKKKVAADSLFTLFFDPEGGTNPIQAKSSVNMQFSYLLYDTLFVVDEDFNVSSEIVREVKTSDYSWWTFYINTDVCFSDGTPITAYDIVYSIQRAQQFSFYQNRLSCVYGSSAYNEEMFALSATQPNSQLTAMLNVPIIKNNANTEDWPLGSGPYMLNEDHTALVPNPYNRHRDELPLETIYLGAYTETGARITAFEDALVDIVTNDPTGAYNLGYGSGNETRYYDTTSMHYIGFNTRSNYFLNNNTRNAIGFLLDRDYLVNSLMGGCGVTAALPVHPRSPLYDTAYASQFHYDPDVAWALFEAGGVAELDGDEDLEISVSGIVVQMNIKFICNNDSAVKLVMARRLAEELNAMGITTTLYELSWGDYLQTLKDGDFDMYYGEVRLRPDWDLTPMLKVPNLTAKNIDWKMNYARISDDGYADYYAAYLAAPEETRYELFQEAMRRVCDSAVIIPMCFERREVLTHRGAVANLHPTQYDLFNKFYEWSITLE